MEPAIRAGCEAKAGKGISPAEPVHLFAPVLLIEFAGADGTLSWEKLLKYNSGGDDE
jgi:hypothetical protein